MGLKSANEVHAFDFQILFSKFFATFCMCDVFAKISKLPHARILLLAKDGKGNRYCINLVSVAGLPPTV